MCRFLRIAVLFFFFQAEDGIRDLVRSRGLGDVYKRQGYEEEKVFSFGRNREFRMEMETLSGVAFYVKKDYFLDIINSAERKQVLYRKVETQYEQHLAKECEYERHQKAHMEGVAEELDDPSAAQASREFRASSCDLYRQKYGRFPSQRQRQQYGQQRGGQRQYQYQRGW
eukprot:TRINITY_DN4663_c0_g1_i4.p1 TRINITY_DN4663_c0_g1~~TRINITY_DN4663_c0_g1_i4.p1  ORF type:complete len:170 (+),score=39.31 TRINITY_DN4663_c0_g1_i4:24-533(+)